VLVPLLLTTWNISHFSVLNSVKMDKGLMQWYDCSMYLMFVVILYFFNQCFLCEVCFSFDVN